MGHGALKKLDEESRALLSSWDDIVRVTVHVLMVAVLVWGASALLRALVHESLHAVLHFAVVTPLWGPLALSGSLVLGGLVRGLLNRRPAWRDAAGDGMDVALGNYHVTYDHEGDDPQPRYALPAFGLAARKGVATLVTLGSGGSGGLESPVVLMGECIGAGWARIMRARSEHELRTYQLAAIAAAVATLLGAPFTAALFAIEVAYGDRIIYRKLAYALLAAIVAYVLNNHLIGAEPLFVITEHARTYTLAEYGVTVLVAVFVSAPIALGFGWLTIRTRRAVERFDPVVRGLVGAGATALVVLALWFGVEMEPGHVLGMGEDIVAALLSGAGDARLGTLWFLLLAILGRMLTTGLTLESGGSAGLLVPSMFFGGMSGAAMASLLSLVGMGGLDPAIFVVAGIASALVAVVGVPMAAIALVLEIFGPAYGPPAVLACGLTYVVTLRFSLYGTQRTSPTPTADEVG
ncbi:MAG: chloride channel protein [Deltaproteobacteria bacterium]|nr:MAG: chloride channel protein [Deltaproteobacteria bacterium]